MSTVIEVQLLRAESTLELVPTGPQPLDVYSTPLTTIELALAPMGQSGIGADTAVVQASENLATGDFVNIWDDDGDFRVRRADAGSVGKTAHGFVLSVVTSGNSATVYFEGANTQVTGQTAGVKYLSATTPGGVQATAPTVAGQVSQAVGVAVSATEINVELGQHYVL